MKVHFGHPEFHYEAWHHTGDGRLEIGLHFEGSREENQEAFDFFRAHVLEVKAQLPRAELYLVTTPQLGTARIAQRAGSLARQLRLPIRGIIENMSYFRTPDGTRYELFGSGGGQLLATTLEVPLLAQVPLVPATGDDADEGIPAVIADPEGEVAKTFADLAAHIVAAGPARVYRKELSIS